MLTLRSTVAPFLAPMVVAVGALLTIIQRRWKRRMFEQMVEETFLGLNDGSGEVAADEEFTVVSQKAEDEPDENSPVGGESEAGEGDEEEYDSADDSSYATEDDDGNESEEIDSGADY